MSTAWRIVNAIVMMVAALGLVGLGVGILTGAEIERIIAVFDDKYSVIMWYQWFVELFNSLATQL